MNKLNGPNLQSYHSLRKLRPKISANMEGKSMENIGAARVKMCMCQACTCFIPHMSCQHVWFLVTSVKFLAFQSWFLRFQLMTLRYTSRKQTD